MNQNNRFKFRVWDKKNNKFWHRFEGVTRHGIIITSEGTPGLVTDVTDKKDPNKKCFYFDSEFLIVQFYTGIKDKNGAEIYEGDLINFVKKAITHGPEAEEVKNAEVWYSQEDAQFVFGKYKMKNSKDYWWYSMSDDLRDIEMVGNIFENN